MKIAFYIGSLSRGGAERVICNLADFFFEKGYEVIMVTKLKEEDEYFINSNIKRIIADISPEEETRSRIHNFVARVKKLRNVWKKEEPDIIISFIKKNNFMAIISSLFMKNKVVVSVRSAPEREYKKTTEKILAFILFRVADGIVLQTKRAFDFFPKGIQKRAIRLRNSISPEFIGEPYYGSRRKEVITVGRIDDNKNQIMLVKAFERVMNEFPEWICKVYGDGESAHKLEKYIKNNGLSQRIKLMGRVSNVRENIEQASIFVLPSKIEGMPNALIEAMALGMAVISTDCPCGGPNELIEHEKNGLLINVDDEHALVNALKLLMSNEEKCDKLGEEAKKIVNILAPEKVNQEWKEYVDRLLSENI